MANFFDKLADEVGRSINNVSTSSKNMVEKANINTQIRGSDKERSRILQNIGTIVYNLHMNGETELEACNAMFSEITAIDKRILDLQQRINEIDSAKMQTAAPPQANGIVCECGHANAQGAKFCANCGKEL